MDPNYFEGYLQLRDCDKEVLQFVHQRMQKENVTVATTTKRKNGVDYKLSSNDFLKKMAKELPQRFTGISTSTKKLFSRDRQTGKNIYRGTLLFQQLPYKVGDVIEHEGEEIEILSIGKKVTAKKKKSGQKFFLER